MMGPQSGVCFVSHTRSSDIDYIIILLFTVVAPAGYDQDDKILRVEDSYDENNMAEKTGEAIHVLVI